MMKIDIWKFKGLWNQMTTTYVLKLELYTEISIYMFHSQKPADLNFPPNIWDNENVSIMFKTYQMISNFHLYFRTDVESYFVIGQLHVNQIHRPISVLTLCNFIFLHTLVLWFPHAGRYLPQNWSDFINLKKPLQSYLQIWS